MIGQEKTNMEFLASALSSIRADDGTRNVGRIANIISQARDDDELRHQIKMRVRRQEK